MASTTVDYSLTSADGWTLVASSPGFLKIKAASTFNYYVAIVATSATPAVTLVGLQQAGTDFTIETPISGDVFVRVGVKPNIIRVTQATSSASGGGTSDATAANQTLQITQETLINTRLGDITAPAAGSVNARLGGINTTLGSPFQAGGSIGNTTFASTQSGTWNITNVSGTISLPTGASTAAKQPALGTAGAASTDVITVQGITSGTPLITAGAVAHDGVDSGNPSKIGGYASSSAPASVSIADRVNAWYGLNGQTVVGSVISSANSDAVSNNAGFLQGINTSSAFSLSVFSSVFNGTTWDRMRGDTGGTVTQPYALTGSRWQYAAAAGGISNTTTAVTFIAAAGASVRNYVTGVDLSSSALGAATEVVIRDGAGGTVLWRGIIGTAGISGVNSINFASPLKGTANTLLEVATLTASITGNIYFNARGYQGT